MLNKSINRYVKKCDSTDPADPVKRLATAVIIQAIKDLRSNGNPVKKLSAWVFFNDLPLWLDGMGLDIGDNVDINQFLPARRGRKKLKKMEV